MADFVDAGLQGAFTPSSSNLCQVALGDSWSCRLHAYVYSGTPSGNEPKHCRNTNSVVYLQCGGFLQTGTLRSTMNEPFLI